MEPSRGDRVSRTRRFTFTVLRSEIIIQFSPDVLETGISLCDNSRCLQIIRREQYHENLKLTSPNVIMARPYKIYLFSDSPDRKLIGMARVQINCEVVCKACFTHMLYIWTVIIIIRHTIAIKVIDTHITNSLCCRKILKTQNQQKARGCAGEHRSSLFIGSFRVSWQIVNSVVIFESHFESTLMSDLLSFTIGCRLIPQTAFNEKREDVLLSADNL